LPLGCVSSAGSGLSPIASRHKITFNTARSAWSSCLKSILSDCSARAHAPSSPHRSCRCRDLHTPRRKAADRRTVEERREQRRHGIVVVHRRYAEQIFHGADHADRRIERAVHDRVRALWRELAHDQSNTAMSVDMVGSSCASSSRMNKAVSSQWLLWEIASATAPRRGRCQPPKHVPRHAGAGTCRVVVGQRSITKFGMVVGCACREVVDPITKLRARNSSVRN